MPRQAGSFVDNNFSRGLITEATGLNFPEDAATETFDCVFDPDGTVTRRAGWEYESGYATSSVTRDDSVISSYMWEGVAGTGDVSFCVVQIGDTIHFWQVDESGALSADKKSFTITLSTYQTAGSPNVKSVTCQFSDGNGYLFVTHPYIEPLFVSYDADGDSITVTEITVEVRDLDGLDEGNNYSDRPSTLTDTHEYNLLNQGWGAEARNSDGDTEPALDEWDDDRSDFPSNADIWWLFKDSTDRFNTGWVNRIYFGNTPAPRGHFILEAFNKDRSDVSGVAGLSTVTSSYFRPTTNVFAGGRVFFSGVNYTKYNTRIYFSQLIDDTDQFGYCYQRNDPTSEHISDLLPTDGGVIVIPDLDQVVKLVHVGGVILVFATNGVWAIAGREGVTFDPTDYSVRRLSSVPALSGSSFVSVETGLPIWWNNDGIYTVRPDQTGNLQVQSLTESTIQTFYDAIPIASKEYAKGAYNSLDNVVQWVYRSSATADVDNRYDYDRVLTFNVQSGAFYPWTVSQPASGPRINGVVASKGSGASSAEEDVTNSSGTTVTNSALATVTATVTTTTQLPSSFRFLTTIVDSGTTYDFTFSQAWDTTYFDWTIFTAAEEYESYFITGYRIHGEAQRRFQVQDVFFYFVNETGASCYFQPIWDYASVDTGGRWGTEQQIVSSRAYYGVQQSKRGVRGSGYSLQLRVRSDGGSPFSLIGWSAFETANAGT